MRKSTKLLKRLVALFLVVLISIESFAAIVSDNDGAAFITKAEFDSLKNEFKAQIDQYNTSIDSKIDGAIASYLEGIKVDKQSKIYMIDNIKHYMDINNVSTTDARVDLVYSLSSVDNKTGADANWYMGYEGNAKILTAGTTGQGVVAECVDTTNKIYVIGKKSSIEDSLTATLQVRMADRGPVPGVSGRVGVWQLTWAIGDSWKYNNEYFSTQQFDEKNFTIYPGAWGKDTQVESYHSAGTYAQKPWLYAHKRVTKSLDDTLGFFINDGTVNTLYDDTYYNGVRLVRDTTLSNSTIDGWFKIVNNSFSGRTTGADNNNPFYREWNGHTDSGWSLIGATSSNVYLGMYKEVNTWNNIARWTSAMFDGVNKELYVAPIYNPDRVCVDNYISDEWINWASKISDTDKVVFKNNKYLWNIRYGNLLFIETIKDEATVKVEVKNNKSSVCYIKFVTNPTQKKFADVQGILTDKSDSTNKNAIKINGSAKSVISFKLEDNVPVFFKLSDGADVTFGDYILMTTSS